MPLGPLANAHREAPQIFVPKTRPKHRRERLCRPMGPRITAALFPRRIRSGRRPRILRRQEEEIAHTCDGSGHGTRPSKKAAAPISCHGGLQVTPPLVVRSVRSWPVGYWAAHALGPDNCVQKHSSPAVEPCPSLCSRPAVTATTRDPPVVYSCDVSHVRSRRVGPSQRADARSWPPSRNRLNDEDDG